MKSKDHRFIDRTGQKFNRLTFLEPTDQIDPKNGFIWKLRCDCGNEILSGAYRVVSGNKKTCGCAKILQKDRTGQKFGRLTFIRPHIDKRNSCNAIMWELLCDCGKTCFQPAPQIVSGKSQSCGCLMREAGRQNGLNKRIYDPYISAARSIWSQRYTDGDIDFDAFLSLSQQTCFYCGNAPNNISTRKYGKNKSQTATFIYNGLDRITSTQKHNRDNVVPCCHPCNTAKHDMEQSAFLDLMSRIYDGYCNAPYIFKEIDITPNLVEAPIIIYGHPRKYNPWITAARNKWNDNYSDGDIDFDTFLSLSQQDCFYCRRPPHNERLHHYGIKDKETVVFTYSGLDRVDPTIALHNKDNVVPCCWDCNFAKNNMTQQEFFDLACRITQRHSI